MRENINIPVTRRTFWLLVWYSMYWVFTFVSLSLCKLEIWLGIAVWVIITFVTHLVVFSANDDMDADYTTKELFPWFFPLITVIGRMRFKEQG